MKKFSFRLEPLLKLRRLHEDEKKRALAVLLDEINEHQRQAVRMADAVTEQSQLLKDRHERGKVDMQWVAHYCRYVSYLQDAIAERIRKIREIQQRVVSARGELAEAAKQTKILEKLKEKRQQRYEFELRRAEGRQQDEIAAHAFQAASKIA